MREKKEKELERVVKKGWKIQIDVDVQDNRMNYRVWAYGHEENGCIGLVGEGQTFSEMMNDFTECEAELVGGN
ncbi:hypothetical protein B834_2388 [Enterococcus mundtii 1A]|uniref:hypothetical protein n=1 Tax=Enterococcus mundtii TaxID=53346 RepID=UPI0023039911|nr:hypothetical protein [Enterococcus mundtii]MDA9428136.1 hypothetical protein [Enterococcus mundtii 1A]MDA9429865.1 hypothetical protein [Enterococcus mundtii 1A]